MKARCFALALVLAGCVEAPETDTTTHELATCSSNLHAPPGAVMPQAGVFNGSLGPDVSAKQVWMVYPTTLNVNGTWVVWQVNLISKTVTWGATFPAGKRTTVFAAIGSKIQPTGGVRFPPGPIGPGGTGNAQVDYLVGAADDVSSGF